MNASNFSSHDLVKWLQAGKGSLDQNGWDWERTARAFGASYVSLGSLAIILNGIFLYTLLVRRARTFSHAFYIIILNFILIDTIKGVCSILFAIKLLKSDMNSDVSLVSIRVDQYSGVLLRFSNLATILNLLMITLNEYIFICYPLRYPTLITRGRVVFFIASAWVISSALTFANMIVGMQNRNLWIDDECTTVANSTSSCVHHLESSIYAHFAYHLGLVVVCLIGLVVTAYSYSILMRVISVVVKEDMRQTAEIERLKEKKSGGDECNVDQKHIIRRHKYVVVIGSVIVVYSAYLTTYAVIQALQLVNMSQNYTGIHRWEFVYLKYLCYLFISVHSLLQPLCYLRMREFRVLLKRTLCGRWRREGTTTDHCYHSQSQKEIKRNNQRAEFL